MLINEMIMPTETKSIALNPDGTFPRPTPPISRHHWWHRGQTVITTFRTKEMQRVDHVCNKCGEVLARFTHFGPFKFKVTQNDDEQSRQDN